MQAEPKIMIFRRPNFLVSAGTSRTPHTGIDIGLRHHNGHGGQIGILQIVDHIEGHQIAADALRQHAHQAVADEDQRVLTLADALQRGPHRGSLGLIAVLVLRLRQRNVLLGAEAGAQIQERAGGRHGNHGDAVSGGRIVAICTSVYSS